MMKEKYGNIIKGGSEHIVVEKNTIYQGEAKKVLKTFPPRIFNTCVTSPPYFRLRNYDDDPEQLGLEETVEEYIDRLVAIMEEVRRTLRDNGTLWINIGDTYAASGKGGGGIHARDIGSKINYANQKCRAIDGYKRKDLIGVPWLVAFALRNAGWYLRCDIIWNKKQTMPESVKDRPTRCHEYIFLLSKSEKYYYDYKSIMTEASEDTHSRVSKAVLDEMGLDQSVGRGGDGGSKWPANWKQGKGDHGNINLESRNGLGKKVTSDTKSKIKNKNNESFSSAIIGEISMTNKRSVWTLGSEGFPEAHYSTFPQKLVVDCIRAGCPEGGLVLDPFAGRNTVGVVARKQDRNFVGIELLKRHIEIAERFAYKELGAFK